jgi:small GTP-binding protein
MTEYLVYVLAGASGVGKSHLMHQYTTNCLVDENPCHTIGIDFAIHRETITTRGTTREVTLKIFDTAGQDRFLSIAHYYMRDASVVALVYDIGNKETFESIQHSWIHNVRTHCRRDTLFVLIGNKSDTNHREVTRARACAYATAEGFMFFECSAKTGDSVDCLFVKTAQQVLINRGYMNRTDKRRCDNIHTSLLSPPVSTLRRNCLSCVIG